MDSIASRNCIKYIYKDKKKAILPLLKEILQRYRLYNKKQVLVRNIPWIQNLAYASSPGRVVVVIRSGRR